MALYVSIHISCIKRFHNINILAKIKKSFNFRDYFRTFIAKNVVDSKIERVQDAVQIPFLLCTTGCPCAICCFNLYDPVGQEIWEPLWHIQECISDSKTTFIHIYIFI